MIDRLVQIAIVGAGAWRLSSMLVYEDGPWGIFATMRRRAGIPPEGGRIDGLFATLLSCLWCTSVWCALALWALWYVHWAIPGVLAAAAVAIWWEQHTARHD